MGLGLEMSEAEEILAWWTNGFILNFHFYLFFIFLSLEFGNGFLMFTNEDQPLL